MIVRPSSSSAAGGNPEALNFITLKKEYKVKTFKCFLKFLWSVKDCFMNFRIF